MGRSAELATAAAALSGGAAGVVFAGEAGLGTTRLAREVISRQRTPGTAVCWVPATAATRRRPLGAFASWLHPEGSDGDASQRLSRAATAVLSLAGPDGLLLCVDGAHHLDDLSAVLVQQLVLRGAVRLVATVRTGEPVPDAVTALWKDGHVQRCDVAPLSREDTARLLGEGLGGRVEPATAARLWATTHGNPLYLHRLVDGERESGRLAETEGAWRWSGDARLSPPLAALIAERIGPLTEAERELLDLLAFGEPLGVALLTSLVEAETLERAEERGLLVVDTDGRRAVARLAHPLFGQARRDAAGPGGARRIRGRLAAALATTGDHRAGDVVRRAALAVDADLPMDAELLADAGRHALELADTRLATRFATAAIEAGGGFEPRLILAWCAAGEGRAADGERLMAELAGMATTDDQSVRLAVARIATLFLVAGRPAFAMAELDRTAAAAAPAARCCFDGLRAGLEAQQPASSGPRPPDQLAAEVLAAHEVPAAGIVLATWGLVTARSSRGRLAGLADAVARSDAATGTAGLGLVQWGSVAEGWTRGLRLAGQLTEAEHVVAGRAVLVEGKGGPLPGIVAGLAAAVDLDRGRVDDARRRWEEARRATVLPRWAVLHAVGRAMAAGMAGDAAAAAAETARAGSVPIPAGHVAEPEVRLATAWVAAAAGLVSVARARAREAAQLAASRQEHAVEVVALHTAVQFGDRTAGQRLTALASRVDGPRAPSAAAHALALAADDGDALLAASDRLDGWGATLLAADAAAQAVAVFDAQGRRGRAHVAAQRTLRLAARCPGASTPALRAVDRPLPLSEREREIVELLAVGRSNREIAAALGISVRTVEGHVYRACTKLDVHDRADLASIVAR